METGEEGEVEPDCEAEEEGVAGRGLALGGLGEMGEGAYAVLPARIIRDMVRTG